MKNCLLSRFFLLLIALPLSTGAQDGPARIKALEEEKALFEAQAARDTAEATRIKAATELLSVKSAASNIDQATFGAKAARDAAESAAAKASAELARDRAIIANLGSEIEKSQLEAKGALIGAKVGADAAEITALKTAFGQAPSIGSDGNISISDSTGGMLLETKSGSLKATAALAVGLCKSLKDAGVKDAFLAPPELGRKILASDFILKEYRAIVEGVNDKNAKAIVLGVARSEVSPAAILSAVTLLQYGAGALQSTAKLLRSDYVISLADGKREAWLEYFTAANCPEQLPLADIEGVIRSRGFKSDIKNLNEIGDFSDAASAKKIQLQRNRDEKAQAIQKKEAGKQTVTPVERDDLESAQTSFEAVAKYDGLVARIKALLDMVATKPDVFFDALVWDTFSQDAKLSSSPRLTVTFTTQDGQITKTHWLMGKSVYGRSSGELVYRASKADGSIVIAGYLLATNSDGELNFGAARVPRISGAFYPASAPR